LYPNDFIPLAERAGLIKQVTLWVLQQALAQRRDWREAGIDIDVAINISANDIHDGAFPEEVAALVRRLGVETNRIRFEIAETAMMADPARAMQTLGTLRAMGIALSIDDFGTGYSSLAYLKQLPEAELKIDKSFVAAMSTKDDDAVIVHSAIELAHNIGLSAAAEGVEDRQTFDMLAALRCDAAQGYYISRPMAPDEFVRWLRQTPWGLRPD
jgi:EAL domain-containing protein (putative c-di-GMP-specific phosphodiesterase class I)